MKYIKSHIRITVDTYMQAEITGIHFHLLCRFIKNVHFDIKMMKEYYRIRI